VHTYVAFVVWMIYLLIYYDHGSCNL